MKFCDRLNLYIETLGCSAKTLSAASGISDAAISRYRSGEREQVPHLDGRSRTLPGREAQEAAGGIQQIVAERDQTEREQRADHREPAGEGDGLPQQQRRRRRSIAIAIALGALVVLFYVVTIAKLGPQILQRPL